MVGCDDIPAAALAVPPLTTVATDSAADAERIARTVVQALTGEPGPPVPTSNTFSLVVRQSSTAGPAPTPDPFTSAGQVAGRTP
ncbi:hypothetical protein GCM10010193_06570 [Kitasatospora atroaurantiaca]|uniref:substrate-binding domain-containing protein n=1 Tax=Kitasatospora atroaurantiaca TaxID=285545 RepID=UPI001FEB27EF|nr:substrate-binding domain-containing protein [Kitasatospora atroaurantiaca]